MRYNTRTGTPAAKERKLQRRLPAGEKGDEGSLQGAVTGRAEVAGVAAGNEDLNRGGTDHFELSAGAETSGTLWVLSSRRPVAADENRPDHRDIEPFEQFDTASGGPNGGPPSADYE